MQEFKVPQSQTPVRVRLTDGQEVDGNFYYPTSAPSGGPGRLIDRLNDPDEHFVPLSHEGEAGWLLNKSCVQLLEIVGEPGSYGNEGDRQIAVSLQLADGTPLKGQVAYSMPSDRGRLLDFLNAAPMFIALASDSKVWLINRDMIATIQGDE